MAKIPFVGKIFPTAKGFAEYLETIQMGTWRPSYITMHHTGGPSLATWRTYAHGTRKEPITDDKWMSNLAGYYGNEQGWSAGPHFFFTPDNFCVLSLPNKRGVHAVSFNAESWGVECVGDFDSEVFTPELADRYAQGFACLFSALGKTPGPYVFRQRGLHFHRDDPKTSKTCPGRKVNKDYMIGLINKHMAAMGDNGSHDDDNVVPPPKPVSRVGRVDTPANDPVLNVRDEASGKSPIVRTLKRGDTVDIIGETMNGSTKWYKIKGDDFVAAAYIKIQ